MNKQNLGSDFDEFLREEQMLEAAETAAIKRLIAFQLENEMKRHQISKSDMAARMKTSRSAVDRLLDPENASVTLATLSRAAAALGRQVRITLTEPTRRSPARAARSGARQAATKRSRS